MSQSAIQTSSSSTSTTSWLPLLGRLLLALIFIMSGVNKLFAPGPTQAYIAAAGLPLPLVAYIVALVVEIGGGVLLLVGYRTREAALALALFTIVAALGFHNNFAEQNQMIHFLKNLAIAGGLLQVVAFGAGSISLDARR
ncbi:MAG: DoxX family protein [Xanthobacteraceae bacterium]